MKTCNIMLISVNNSSRKIWMRELNFWQERNFYGCYKNIFSIHNARTSLVRRTCGICQKKHPTSLHAYTPKQITGGAFIGMGKEILKMQLHYWRTTVLKLKMLAVLQPQVAKLSVRAGVLIRSCIRTLEKNTTYMLCYIVASLETFLG